MDDVPTVFTTARLQLTAARLEDAQAIFDAYAADPDVSRYMTWTAHVDVAEARGYLERCAAEWAAGTGYAFIIALASAPERPIGAIDIHATEPRRVGFGYVLAKPQWGYGYAAEALGALTDWALGQPDIFRAYAVCDVDNAASARVMEKAGMTFEGVLRRFIVHPNLSSEPRDCLIYAKVR